MSEIQTPLDSKNLFDRPMPEGYRDELRELLAATRSQEEHTDGSVLVFTLNGHRLAVPSAVAWAVAPVLHIARIPHRSGTVLLGLVAFRGELLPCCSLARLLDLPSHETSAGRTLILEESAGQRWAIPVDAVSSVQTMRAINTSETPAIPTEWIRNTGSDPNGNFTVLDTGVLFRQIRLATA